MTRSVRIGQKVQRLVLLAEQLTGESEQLTEICYRLLGLDESSGDFIVGASCLNNDSSPLQLCLTCSHKGVSLRVIGDPGAFHHSTELRYNCSVNTLFYFIERTGSLELKTIAKETIDALIPGELHRNGYQQGFVWIGISPDRPGIAFYLEMAPPGHEKGWQAVENWLMHILPLTNTANNILKRLRQHCIVASAGLEGHTIEDCRAKIYFRLLAPEDIDKLGLEIFSSKQMKDFLSIAKTLYEVDQQGLVMSIGFSLLTGELVDAKIDLCGHCLRYTSEEWLLIIRRITDRFSLTPPDTSLVLDSKEYQVAFIGLGLTTDYKPRLNLYVKHDVQTGVPESDEIWGALKDAMRYLKSVQNIDGSWDDYQLPVGYSDQWVTAYSGHALALYGNKTRNRESIDAATKAANWLSTNRSYKSGWGFNGFTGPDSDSTGMAIALFDELGVPVAESDRLFLRDHWRQSDGIATYDEPGAWAIGHWDVTPWGYHGMLPEDREIFRDQFTAALATNRMSNGFWRSYWWRNPYYCTFITLEMLEKLGIPEPYDSYEYPVSSVQIDNPFDLACFIGIECIRNPLDSRIGGHLRALLNWQAVNGQWNGSANLRVTDNFCYTPWDNPSGLYYEDKKSTITTATIIRVLSKIIPTKKLHTEEIAYNWI